MYNAIPVVQILLQNFLKLGIPCVSPDESKQNMVQCIFVYDKTQKEAVLLLFGCFFSVGEPS